MSFVCKCLLSVRCLVLLGKEEITPFKKNELFLLLFDDFLKNGIFFDWEIGYVWGLKGCIEAVDSRNL
jgi:hypothetical protein